MKTSDAREAAALLRPLLTLIVASAAVDASVQSAADLRQAVGSLDAGAETEIEAGTVGTSLGACFDAARAAGATFAGIDNVRAAAVAAMPVSAAAGIVVALVIRQALACACRIVAATDFVSRDEVDSVRDTLSGGFDAAIDAAADDGSQAVVMTLTALRAAAMRDLTARARPLPQMIAYALPRPLPAAAIACRLYGDGARADELIAENRPVHPLFMPAAGRALSR